MKGKKCSNDGGKRARVKIGHFDTFRRAAVLWYRQAGGYWADKRLSR